MVVVTKSLIEQNLAITRIQADSMCGIAQSCSHAGGSSMYMLWLEDMLYQLRWDPLRMWLMLGG